MELCELLAVKCGEIDSILRTGSPGDVARFLGEIATDSESFELVARFCQGYEPKISPENVVSLCHLASHLGMTETHCRNNLLSKAFVFFEHKVLPSWNETVRAFRSAESNLHHAKRIGILGACVESIVSKALSDPHLLGDPVKRVYSDESDSEENTGFVLRPNTKRRLFALSWKFEDLTTLSLRLYEPLMREMIRRGVPVEYVAVSLSDYARKWAFGVATEEEEASVYRMNSRREIVEAVERLLPDERGIVGCDFLTETLRCASVLEASSECKEGLEFRIGRDLHRATVEDFVILSRGNSKEARYDIERVRRVLKHFYGNCTSTNMVGLVRVAELLEEFMAEIASDVDLKKELFAGFAEISMDVSRNTRRSSDGVYKGVDIYLDSHRYLTESEREEVCKVLDLDSMSPEARDHAAKNERLPLRVVLQVLFAAQMELRSSIAREVRGFEEVEEARLLGESGESSEMEKMGRKLVELEMECGAMKREIGGGGGQRSEKKEKVSLWKEMKRKFGCISASVSDCKCQMKRKKRS